jgi:hypothetical protein
MSPLTGHGAQLKNRRPKRKPRRSGRPSQRAGTHPCGTAKYASIGIWPSVGLARMRLPMCFHTSTSTRIGRPGMPALRPRPAGTTPAWPVRQPTHSSPIRHGDDQWLLAEIPVYQSTPRPTSVRRSAPASLLGPGYRAGTRRRGQDPPARAVREVRGREPASERQACPPGRTGLPCRDRVQEL